MRRGLVLLIVAACSSNPKGGTTGGGTGTGAGTATSTGDDGTPAADAAPASTAITRAECETMIDHVLAVGNADMRSKKPPEQWPTEEQLAAIRAKLVEDQLEACLAWDRPSYECVMAAETVDALYACTR